MRVVWNEPERCFEAVFTQGEFWRDDLEAAKAAGFKTNGPPAWTWHTRKAEVLNKLRKNRPKSGVTLTEVALKAYGVLDQQAKTKAEIKKAFGAARKIDKKTSFDPKTSGLTPMKVPSRGYIIASDLPPYIPTYEKFILPPPPKELCLICDEPIYFYEYLICLWCEKEIDAGSTNAN